MKRLIGGLSGLAALLLILLLVLGLAQSLHPAFDSFSHFRLLFAGALILLIPVLWITNRKSIALISVLVSITALVFALPYLPGMSRGFAIDNYTKDWKRMSILQLNMRFNNMDTDRIVSVLRSSPSDVLLLQEVTKTNAPVLAAFAESHPHQLNCFSSGVGSVAIVSKFPFADTQPKECKRFDGFASVTLQVGTQQISVASFHSRWPWPAGQENQIERLTTELNALKTEFSILAGDFNAAPWSEAVRKISTKSGLKIMSGLEFTWAPRVANTRTITKHFDGVPDTLKRVQFPDWFLRFQNAFGPILPIDHVLHSPKLSPLSREVLADAGSDHFPVRTVLVWQ